MVLPLPGGLDDDPDRQDKFDVIASAMPGFGGRSVEIRFGTGTLTWPGGSANSNGVTIAHGLGTVPVVVVPVSTVSQAPDAICVETYSYTSTQFTAHGVYVAGFAPGVGSTHSMAWIAIG